MATEIRLSCGTTLRTSMSINEVRPGMTSLTGGGDVRFLNVTTDEGEYLVNVTNVTYVRAV
jgi:hypothetical protein